MKNTASGGWSASVSQAKPYVLFVLTGTATSIQLDHLSRIEEKVLGDYRSMFKEDQDAIRRLSSTLAEHSSVVNGKTKPQPQDS